jgi:hypothetical protein
MDSDLPLLARLHSKVSLITVYRNLSERLQSAARTRTDLSMKWTPTQDAMLKKMLFGSVCADLTALCVGCKFVVGTGCPHERVLHAQSPQSCFRLKCVHSVGEGKIRAFFDLCRRCDGDVASDCPGLSLLDLLAENVEIYNIVMSGELVEKDSLQPNFLTCPNEDQINLAQSDISSCLDQAIGPTNVRLDEIVQNVCRIRSLLESTATAATAAPRQEPEIECKHLSVVGQARRLFLEAFSASRGPLFPLFHEVVCPESLTTWLKQEGHPSAKQIAELLATTPARLRRELLTGLSARAQVLIRKSFDDTRCGMFGFELNKIFEAPNFPRHFGIMKCGNNVVGLMIVRLCVDQRDLRPSQRFYVLPEAMSISNLCKLFHMSRSEFGGMNRIFKSSKQGHILAPGSRVFVRTADYVDRKNHTELEEIEYIYVKPSQRPHNALRIFIQAYLNFAEHSVVRFLVKTCSADANRKLLGGLGVITPIGTQIEVTSLMNFLRTKGGGGRSGSVAFEMCPFFRETHAVALLQCMQAGIKRQRR